LQDLTEAAEAFRGRNEPLEVTPSGPADLRNAILAFNGMNERLVKLLNEKDRTLGAIGHDLRTPLASLRIRAESVEPAEERDRMIATIEEMTATLEDILTLARVGRSREPFEQTEVSALARSVAEDYREMGQPVTFSADVAGGANVQPNLLRRAIRNLVDNALKYGGGAEIKVKDGDGRVTITVLDRGPGLAPEQLERVTGAFYRAVRPAAPASASASLRRSPMRTAAHSPSPLATEADWLPPSACRPPSHDVRQAPAAGRARRPDHLQRPHLAAAAREGRRNLSDGGGTYCRGFHPRDFPRRCHR
jgi:hypothetical protein